MTSLHEKVLNTVRLTTNQKKVLTRISSAPTAKKAAEEASGERGLIAARDLLIKMKLIIADDETAELTPTGEQLMKDENLIDDMGELTDEGNKFAYDQAKESLLPSLNKQAKLNEGAFKELDIDAQEALEKLKASKNYKHFMDAVKAGDYNGAMDVVARYASDEKVVAAVMVKVAGGNFKDYL